THADRLDAFANVVDLGVGDGRARDDDQLDRRQGEENGRRGNEKATREIHGSLGLGAALLEILPRTTPTTARAGRVVVVIAVGGGWAHGLDATARPRICQEPSAPVPNSRPTEADGRPSSGVTKPSRYQFDNSR